MAGSRDERVRISCGERQMAGSKGEKVRISCGERQMAGLRGERARILGNDTFPFQAVMV